ncbi:hypothetical protein FRX31_032778 [Thalictrum thalictroides]|uniref:Endonuclease/exonuclease/phosphatase domain-containing protein n=1 Tax=Thalictrum thalictroides TaxID=46969 RepID=A0A7J6UYB7_THATH|nr:hypothetical protein FRX31_032778 [Thalictrum thalictroides]
MPASSISSPPGFGHAHGSLTVTGQNAFMSNHRGISSNPFVEEHRDVPAKPCCIQNRFEPLLLAGINEEPIPLVDLTGIHLAEEVGQSSPPKGGIVLAWNSDYVEVIDKIDGAFSVTITCILKENQFSWMMTGVYGPCKDDERNHFIEELYDLRAWSDLPWCIGGDFNVTRFVHERRGRQHITRFMSEFEELVENLNLVDYPLQGARYTWTNGTSFSRIDRFLATADWEAHFSQAKEVALFRSVSDHRVVVLDCSRKRRGSVPFRFEVMWFENDGLLTCIDKWWNSSSFSEKTDEINSIDANEELGPLLDEDEVNRVLLKNELSLLLRKREICWCQKARIKWRCGGEDNTAFCN